MDDLEEAFGNELNVEVTVATGGVSTVTFRTIVKIADSTQERIMVAKLRDVAEILRRALPVSELKAEDHDFNKALSRVPLAVDKSGAPVTQESLVVAGQESLRKLIAQKPPDSKG